MALVKAVYLPNKSENHQELWEQGKHSQVQAVNIFVIHIYIMFKL